MRCISPMLAWAVPLGATLLLALCDRPAYGQLFHKKPCPPAPDCQPAPCPAPAPLTAPTTPAPEPVAPPPQAPETAQAPMFAPEETRAAGGGEMFAAAAPNIIGDAGISAIVGRVSSTGNATLNAQVAGELQARINALKVTENQTPRPTDRVYIGYNYFNNVNNLNQDVHRELWGFERTFLDNNASFGMSLPVFETGSGDAFNVRGFGNLNMIGKYAWINNASTGNVLSSGMVLTVPTGRDLIIPGQSPINDVIFQPWLGYIWNSQNFYVQGFSALMVPTDWRDITIMFNDIAAGYWLMRSNGSTGLTGIIPTVEAHINTPFNHRGMDSFFGLQDSVIMTVGSHFIFNQRSIFTVGVATPVTGPQPFDVEAIAQFNYRF